MKNLQRRRRTGRARGSWGRAIQLAIVLGLLAWPALSLAQDDAGPTAAAEVALDAEPEAAGPDRTSATPLAEVEPAEQTGLQKLSAEVMAIVVPILGTLITGLVGVLLMWLRKKFKLQVSDQSIDSWSKLAGKAANRGAEWARNKAKEYMDGRKVPGPEVLDVAVDWAVETGRTLGLPDIGREKLVGLIEAHLFEGREGNA